MDTSSANLLIISDLHLGEDIRPGLKAGSLKHLVRLERELSAFLLHYTSNRLGDRPWRLVINGDMVDFLGVVLLPNEAELNAQAALNPGEHVFGLGTHPRAALAKIRRVLQRHEGVFRALAEFIAAGNIVDVVVGNHDVEFSWPDVQDTFRSGVAALIVGREAQVAEGIRFHPWFYFEEHVAWVEHGHQYDRYCSFDYVLHPASESKAGAGAGESEIVWNTGAAAQCFITNHAGGHVDGQESWGFMGYLRWALSLHKQGLLARIAAGFLAANLRLLAAWHTHRAPEVIARRREHHRARLAELAGQFRLSEDTLHAVDALRLEPMWRNLGRMLASLMVNRLLIYALAAVLVMVQLLALPWSWAIGSVLGTVAAATWCGRWLQRARETTDPSVHMRAVTDEIRRRVSARYVIFGHTHAPLAIPLADGGMYLNTGTWVQREREPLAFTHVLIHKDSTGPHAALCEWRDGCSREVRKA